MATAAERPLAVARSTTPTTRATGSNAINVICSPVWRRAIHRWALVGAAVYRSMLPVYRPRQGRRRQGLQEPEGLTCSLQSPISERDAADGSGGSDVCRGALAQRGRLRLVIPRYRLLFRRADDPLKAVRRRRERRKAPARSSRAVAAVGPLRLVTRRAANCSPRPSNGAAIARVIQRRRRVEKKIMACAYPLAAESISRHRRRVANDFGRDPGVVTGDDPERITDHPVADRPLTRRVVPERDPWWATGSASVDVARTTFRSGSACDSARQDSPEA